MLTISQFAKLAGVTPVTIRYYEKNGLLPKNQRAHNGYRRYAQTLLKRMTFITNAKAVGFSLGEIKQLLKLQEQTLLSSEIKRITQTKLTEIDQKIDHLIKIKTLLSQLNERCDGRQPIDRCPILQGLQASQLTS